MYSISDVTADHTSCLCLGHPVFFFLLLDHYSWKEPTIDNDIINNVIVFLFILNTNIMFNFIVYFPLIAVSFFSFLPLLLFSTSILQPYESQLFSLCVQCLTAVAKALPPHHTDSSCLSNAGGKALLDTEQFDPHPVDTSR